MQQRNINQMPGEWLSTKEVAEILQCTERTIQRKIKQGKITNIRQVEFSQRGYMTKKYEIHISDPLLAGKTAYSCRQFNPQGDPPRPMQGQMDTMTTSTVILNQTAVTKPKDIFPSVPAPHPVVSDKESKYDIASYRLIAVEEALRAPDRKIEIAQKYNISIKTLYRYIEKVSQAIDSLPLFKQQNPYEIAKAKIQALFPQYNPANKGIIKCFSKEAINYIKGIYLSPSCLTIAETYRYLQQEASIYNWRIGSKKSLERILSQIPPSQICYAREGVRKWEAKFGYKILRDYTEIWPNFMWVGDHHIFDCFVKDPSGRPRRPWITAWLDMRTRSFMGWCISFSPSSHTIALALRHAILPKKNPKYIQYGLPLSIYIDNGKDYKCKYLNGEEEYIGNIDYPEEILRFQALGIDPFYLDMEYDPNQAAWIKKDGIKEHIVKSIKVGGVFARLGINTKFATAYHPWAKPIERAFREIVQNFSRTCPGWCGSGHEQRPEKLVFELKSGQIFDLPQFEQYFEDFIINRYHMSPHTGHGMDNMSPTEVFQRLLPKPENVSSELLDFALLRKNKVKIHNWGFNLHGHKYELAIPDTYDGAVILDSLIGTSVDVLFDLSFRTIRIYRKGKYICDGRLLRRASFLGTTETMSQKIRLQKLQKQVSKAVLSEVQQSKTKITRIHPEVLDEIPIPQQSEDEYNAQLAMLNQVNQDIQNTTNSQIEDEFAQYQGERPYIFHEIDYYKWCLIQQIEGKQLEDIDILFMEEFQEKNTYRMLENHFQTFVTKYQQYKTKGGICSRY